MTLTGLYVPLITPFDDNDKVALDALEKLAVDTLTAGAAGLVALGTTAEPSSLSEAERRTVLDVVAGVCHAQNAQLIVGANTPDALAKLTDRTAAALTLVPPFVRPGERGVVAYFEHLAAVSPVPLVAYHVPYRTGQSLSAATIRRLAAIRAVVGIKYAAGGIDEDTVDLMAEQPADFAVLGGDDPFIAPLLALGATGGILASALVAPAEFAALLDAYREGDLGTARPLGHKLAKLSRALFAAPNPTVIKAVLHACGTIPTPAVRLPLVQPEASIVRTARELADPRSSGLR
ncbi:4-hydroxy-tetrahydrodipicolinate synthase [Kribbella amoyensis]|uniref:4-hydroxy-tetrahydrodipicolinate synthase n=1 Tax=Kribbella amoyensis TaxID=996641 RepID=A0A561BZ02_9ACTN|nr:dihydrodipicolinate synthase family protein [Kribbella amoyensis]TWD84139.1 4-hydroxy-tetrahydrodipicolinate synthase [Kribbella amoyensis]